jgi:hypothetical protein
MHLDVADARFRSRAVFAFHKSEARRGRHVPRLCVQQGKKYQAYSTAYSPFVARR